ncbi:MAG: hypothetical protein H6632_00770 [Anaerolineales bacterium]|nr:hypothetical protein [Anaerolineales bacterium]
MVNTTPTELNWAVMVIILAVVIIFAAFLLLIVALFIALQRGMTSAQGVAIGASLL